MDGLRNFGTIFISLILEGFPFLIIGALVSSVIQLMVSDDTIGKLRVKSKFLSLLIMALAGIVFPVCECAIVPIVRRLVKKGMPVGMAVTFMTAVPIVNPVVFMSTYYAFLGHTYMAFLRIGLGILCSMAIGFLVGELTSGDPLRNSQHMHHEESCDCHHHGHHHGHCDEHCHGEEEEGKLKGLISHVSEEFYEIGRFFIFGSLLSSTFQTFIPREYILKIGGGQISSIIVMMLMAFVLSICSETDAFIGRSFFNQFTGSSVMAFLIFGPMIDIKNTVMLMSNFKLNFVAKLVFVIVAVTFLAAAALSLIPAAAVGWR
ncbi:MAG: permease [Bacillota bacterium]|nr:permease [Bacillota bacterium]